MKITHGKWQVTRFCCTSAMCFDCIQRGTHSQKDKRARVVQLDGLSRETAQQVAMDWALYEGKAERMKGVAQQ